MKRTRRKVGKCGVDSGMIYVIDPCYIEEGLDYEGLVDMGSHRPTRPQDVPAYLAAPYNGGVYTSTGYGDGVYPVYVTIVDDPTWGKRVAKLEIVFIEE